MENLKRKMKNQDQKKEKTKDRKREGSEGLWETVWLGR